MMSDAQKQAVLGRLRRIEGQVRGLQKMVVDDRYCMDVMAQTRSVLAAVRAVEDVILEQHLKTCVADAMRANDLQLQDEKVDEMMSLLNRIRKSG